MSAPKIPAACKGKTGQALFDCLDIEEAKSAKTAHAARVIAGYASGEPEIGITKTTASGNVRLQGKTDQAYMGAVSVSSGQDPARCHIIGWKNKQFGNLWTAFVLRNDAGTRKYKTPLDRQIQALDSAIKKLDDENSITSKLERFVTSPLSLITAAIAAYATMGASLGATITSIVKDDDSIESAIKKLQKLRDELVGQSMRWFKVYFPTSTLDYFPVGSYLRCATATGVTSTKQGTDPITVNFRLWLEEEFG